ncbi:Winged helix DNA-binding domain-containing protein [Sanguibacter gelidistatuariae]|uniref:Winged helix DNA-binding domain-containing protein n=1 Tax=Sanguibacter gelidistatuariae TaxID=1814289 RepID=A0A1G6QL01_9MICO|nr:crosslink repair DNA glycosylase YcaQ family protein [Sanguibacter gelidistatuariae]SDC92881.1 Winged helix DNA-binding domain-containing protein [Sanguibacter gelidistatuariae]
MQDTGADGAAWALTNRALPVGRGGEEDAGLALAWTLRGAPHTYRRADLAAVACGVSPFSEPDAARRIYGAAKPLRAAGIDVLDALRTVASHLHEIVTEPMPKGEVSSRLTPLLPAPYLRWCAPCHATHTFEMPFRLAALQAGLDLVPGTSPPTLRPIPGWHLDPFPLAPPEQEGDQPPAGPRDVLASFRRFYPYAGPKHAAAYLDAPVAEVTRRWPQVTAEPTDQAGASGAHEHGESGALRLLGPYDPFLQLKDRELLISDAALRKRVWPTLGRPGVVVADGTAIALWRPRATGRSLSVRLEELEPLARSTAARIEGEGARLAAHRGLTFAGITRL